MANTVTEFTEAIKCINHLNSREKKAALVYYLLADAVDNGTVASNDLDLLSINASCFKMLSEPQIDSALVAVAAQKAVANGAAVSATDINALATAIKCLKLQSDHALHTYELYLRDKLTQS